MRNFSIRAANAALALSLGLALSGCAGLGMGSTENRSLNVVHQPVVSHTNFTLDVNSGAGGLSLPEQRRLSGWFEAMDLRYGDRISVDDPLDSGSTRSAVEAVAGKFGMLVEKDAPVTSGQLNPGTVRVVITRASASVPGCPDWSAKSDSTFNNATSSNYGCATNGNLAAMVANPDHLLEGAKGSGITTVMSSTKAIDSYRKAPPTGEQGLKASATSSNSGGK